MEEDQVPAVCEKCLGDNPYLRMVREQGGEKCHMCQRTYTTFRWVPRKNHPWSKTTICKNCSRVKNCCQCCMLDLAYGLPIAIRDEALKMVSNATAIEGSTDRTRLYAIAQQEHEHEQLEHDDTNQKARDLLQRLAHAKSNDSKSIKDKEKDEEDGGEDKDRVDPDSNSIAAKLPFNSSLADPPPKDQSITSFFIYGIDDQMAESDVRGYFGQFGDLKSLQIVHRAKCGFVIYTNRKQAQLAAEALANKPIVIKGCKLKAAWGKPRSLGSGLGEQAHIASVVRKAIKGKIKLKKKVPKAKLESKQAESSSPAIDPPPIDPPVGNANNTFEL